MLYHEEKKLAFIAHPRTASSATANTLTNHLGFTQIGTHHSIELEVLDHSDVVFATIRHPFDMMVSWYYSYLRKGRDGQPTFKEWLPKFLKKTNEYIESNGLFFAMPYCNRILRFETLQEDFDRLLADVDLPQTEIPRKNVSLKRERRPFIKYYNWDLTCQMVRRFGDVMYANGYAAPPTYLGASS